MRMIECIDCGEKVRRKQLSEIAKKAYLKRARGSSGRFI